MLRLLDRDLGLRIGCPTVDIVGASKKFSGSGYEVVLKSTGHFVGLSSAPAAGSSALAFHPSA